ncbi:MAG: DNA primase, partial [Halanaerobiales bacterium]
MADDSRDFSQKVKRSVDIVEVVSDYVNLKKVGKNYQALCPFHQENTPSFTVNPENQFYYCFGCGAGGDVYDFLMEIENITFFESLKILAGRVGLEIPNQSRKSRRINKKRETFFELYRLAARFYNYLLRERDIARQAREYLQQRGFEEEEIEKFHLGYAPDRWRALLKFLTGKGYDREELLEAGLISKSNNNYYDRFRNRIIFPIFNVRGEVLSFGGRIINNNIDSPKYLNSPETLLYSKGDNLYGLNWARDIVRKEGSAVIMEGYTD